ncbi:MAG: heme-binding protein [Methylococcales bacterium]
MKKNKKIISILSGALLLGASANVFATCNDILSSWLPADIAAVGANGNGGYGLPMWISAVDENGIVCVVVNSAGSGAGIGNKSWLGSRVISMQKANTANNFSLDGFSISTANLYGLTQPGGSLFGLQESNPINDTIAYSGNPSAYGAGTADPAVGQRIGGTNVFGGGLALYKAGKKVGAIGVSGDTSCTDHATAWKLRALMGLNSVPAGFISGYNGKPSWAIGDEMIIRLDGNVTNSYKQVSCAHNTILNPSVGAAQGVIIE